MNALTNVVKINIRYPKIQNFIKIGLSIGVNRSPLENVIKSIEYLALLDKKKGSINYIVIDYMTDKICMNTVCRVNKDIIRRNLGINIFERQESLSPKEIIWLYNLKQKTKLLHMAKQGTIWFHCTKMRNLIEIIKDGEIKPLWGKDTHGAFGANEPITGYGSCAIAIPHKSLKKKDDCEVYAYGCGSKAWELRSETPIPVKGAVLLASGDEYKYLINSDVIKNSGLGIVCKDDDLIEELVKNSESHIINTETLPDNWDFSTDAEAVKMKEYYDEFYCE
ncbi:hypothetical protein ACFLZV_01475 [Candidatus Margulisiibacteriota bacterium]